MFLLMHFSVDGGRIICAAIELFCKAASIPVSFFPFYVLMVKFLGLLVKGGDLFKNVISAPRAYRTLLVRG